MRVLFILALVLVNNAIFAQSHPDEALLKLGIKLPAPSKPIANYVKWNRVGNVVYTSGHGPSSANGSPVTGRLGQSMTVEQGYEAARNTGIQLLATLKDATGDLGKVKRIVKVLGLVNCTADFERQPEVINGFSDLMVQVFGEKGKHARSAVGTNALPRGIPVEIEMIVEVE
jgi:enamine deaminase RidA (YjgF/YER057c/UK114 family)